MLHNSAVIEASRFFQRGEPEKAIALMEQTSREHPEDSRVWNILALSRHAIGEHTAGIADLNRAIALRPDDAEQYYNLGILYQHAGDSQRSMESHQEAVKRDPTHDKALHNLGVYFGRIGHLAESVTCFKRSLEKDPANASVLHNFGNMFKETGLLTNAIDMYKQALDVQPMEGTASTLCYVNQFLPGVTLPKLYEIHKEWGDTYAAHHKHSWIPHTNVKDPDRPLRVGFISEDFREHTVGNYLIDTFTNLPEDLELYCYSLKNSEDPIATRFKAKARSFQDVTRLSVTELTGKIREDRIDVLFDLSGHTSGNRLMVFARKPAPIQMSWLGYVGTIGMEAIDYVIANHQTVPIGAETYFCEKVLRFSRGLAHQCYRFPDHTVERTEEPPSDKNGYVTFGTVSTLAKLNKVVLAVWGRILRKCENSKLLIRAAMTASGQIQKMILDSLGVDKTRVIFEGRASHKESLETYNRIDIALDPWPFSGCTTTCEALSMGVPVVTFPQQTEASRHALAFLNGIGAVNMVAHNEAEYIDAAVGFAQDLGLRRFYRKELSSTFLTAPVCDAKRYARELYDMIRDSWKGYCNE